MTASVFGRIGWGASFDDQGNREYDIEWLVNTSHPEEGPGVVANAVGLPTIGARWEFGLDSDPWAFCRPSLSISKTLGPKNEPGYWWAVGQKFSTKPITRCQDAKIENPISEPPDISGSFVKYTREISKDRHGKAVRTTSHEMIRGAQAEFDANRPTVSIKMNTLFLPTTIFAPFIDAVNDAPLWGLETGMVKLSNASWSRHFYGRCSVYYTASYDFDISFKGWKRKVASEGTKVLIGWGGSGQTQLDPDAIDASTGEANYKNPKNFEVYKDVNGENTRVMLDEKGRPVADGDLPYEIEIDHYEPKNLLELGIPSSF